MRVEILEKRISDQDPETGHQYVAQQGDVLTVPDAVGNRWCHYGWAKDVDGVITTGERIEGSREPHESDPRREAKREKVKPDTPLDVQKSTIAGGRK